MERRRARAVASGSSNGGIPIYQMTETRRGEGTSPHGGKTIGTERRHRGMQLRAVLCWSSNDVITRMVAASSPTAARKLLEAVRVLAHRAAAAMINTYSSGNAYYVMNLVMMTWLATEDHSGWFAAEYGIREGITAPWTELADAPANAPAAP